MKKIFLALIFVFVFSISLAEGAQDTLLNKCEEMALQGVDLVHQEKIGEAIDVFKKIIELYPEHPIGYFFTAAVYQTLIDDYRTDKYKSEFLKYIEQAIEKGSERVNPNPNAKDYFYLGASYGYRGIYRAFHGGWWGAFRDGVKGKGFLEKALEKDSTLYDCYFGLGTYHYWRSVKSKAFWWLPFIGDDRPKGIRYTKLSIEKGNFARIEGQYALIRIYAEEKDYKEVLNWAEKVKPIFESDPFTMWLVGSSYIGLHKLSEAESTYQKLLSFLKSSTYYDKAAEAECRYNLAYIYYLRNDLSRANSNLGFIFANQEEIKDNEYARAVLEAAVELKKRIAEKLATQE